MSIVRLDHVQLAMPAGREAEAVAFYDGLLGIPNIPARKAHAALIVDDLDTLIATLTAAGHIPRDDEPLEGYHRVYVDDPFGNRLELMELDPAEDSEAAGRARLLEEA